MDTETARTALGDTGLAGVAFLLVGILLVGRENRRAAIGAVVVVVGYSLVAHGLVGSFLETMGMEYDDVL